MSLVAFLAWVGLGADGLVVVVVRSGRSVQGASATGSPRAATTLRSKGACTFIPDHAYLAVFLAGAIAATVFIISWSYRRIIEEFPHGGGGYIVATKHLGPYVGAVSGWALLVDYVLTIAVSLASGVDAVLDFVPDCAAVQAALVLGVLALLTLMNLRGVKESVRILTPIFLVFLVTHAMLIFGAVGTHLGQTGEIATTVSDRIARSHISTAGLARRRARVHARVLARRRHVHRHRGGLERHRDHARAAGAHREAHDAADGDLARDHRERHPARVPAAARHARARQDDERACSPRSSSATGAAGTTCFVVDHARLGRRAAVRRGAGGLRRRPARDGEHGARLVAAASHGRRCPSS